MAMIARFDGLNCSKKLKDQLKIGIRRHIKHLICRVEASRDKCPNSPPRRIGTLVSTCLVFINRR